MFVFVYIGNNNLRSGVGRCVRDLTSPYLFFFSRYPDTTESKLMDWNLVILYLITWLLSSNCHFILAAVYIFWLVVSNIFYLFISYMGCHPSHWRTHIFQDGRYTTNQLHIVLPITHWYSWFFGHGDRSVPGGPGPPGRLRFVRPDGLAGDKHDARQYFNSFLNQCGKVAGAKGLRRVFRAFRAGPKWGLRAATNIDLVGWLNRSQ